MKQSNKNTFIFNLEWDEILSELPKEVKYEVYDAIIEYAKSGKLPDLKPMAKIAFQFIKKEIDKNQSVYEYKCLTNRENGKKGGRPKKPKNRTVLKEKEKTKEQERFPPDPLSKEKENKKEKETTPNPLAGGLAVAVAKEKIIPEFFSKQISLDGFCKANSTNPEELRRLAEEVFDEWELVNETDLSERHLVNSIRIKLKTNNANSGKGAGQNWSGNNGKQFRGAVDFDCGLIED